MPGRYARNSSKTINADINSADFAAWEAELDFDVDTVRDEEECRSLVLA